MIVRIEPLFPGRDGPIPARERGGGLKPGRSGNLAPRVQRAFVAERSVMILKISGANKMAQMQDTGGLSDLLEAFQLVNVLHLQLRH